MIDLRRMMWRPICSLPYLSSVTQHPPLSPRISCIRILAAGDRRDGRVVPFAAQQGLTLVHRFGSSKALVVGYAWCRTVTKMAQVELKNGRVQAPAAEVAFRRVGE